MGTVTVVCTRSYRRRNKGEIIVIPVPREFADAVCRGLRLTEPCNCEGDCREEDISAGPEEIHASNAGRPDRRDVHVYVEKAGKANLRLERRRHVDVEVDVEQKKGESYAEYGGRKEPLQPAKKDEKLLGLHIVC